MPIYEFTCHSCSHEFEQIVPFSATTTPACPACTSADVDRHMSRPAIHFKGSGWYITDSRKGNGKHSNNGVPTDGKAESNAESSAESKGSDAGDSKAESKTEAKSESKSGDTAKASTKTTNEA